MVCGKNVEPKKALALTGFIILSCTVSNVANQSPAVEPSRSLGLGTSWDCASQAGWYARYAILSPLVASLEPQQSRRKLWQERDSGTS